MKRPALFILLLCSFAGALSAGFSLGRPAAVKKRVSKLDDKVRAEQLAAAAPNRAPVISAMVAVSTTVATDGNISVSVTAYDPDNDTLTYSWTPSTATFIGTGATVSFVAPSALGVYGVTCTVSDGKGHSAQQTVQITAVLPGTGRWMFHTGAAIVTVPAIGSDGTVYVGSTDGKLYAVKPDGTQKWFFNAGSPINSSPAIGADGAVYFGADDGKLHAIDGATHQEKTGWPFVAGGAIKSSPAIGPDGVIYAGSDDEFMYAVNPDGTKKWKYDAGTGSQIRSSPAFGADTVYVGDTKGYVYALDISTGGEKWLPLQETVLGAPINSSLALGSNGNIYLGGSDGYLYSVSSTTGLETGAFGAAPYSPVNSSPAIDASGVIYVGSDDWNVYAVTSSAGAQKWAFPLGGAVRSSPAIGVDGTLYVGADDGKLYAIDTMANPAAGVQKWAFATSPAASIKSSPAVAPDGTVYFGADDGNLYAVCGDTPLAATQWPKFHRDAKNTGR